MPAKILVPNKRLSANDVETYVDDLNEALAAVDSAIIAFNLQIDATKTASDYAERFQDSVPLNAIELNEALAGVAELIAMAPEIQALKGDQSTQGFSLITNAHNTYATELQRGKNEAELVYANQKITALIADAIIENERANVNSIDIAALKEIISPLAIDVPALNERQQTLNSDQLTQGFSLITNAHNTYATELQRGKNEAGLVYANQNIAKLTEELAGIKSFISQ
jgi:hypothetical protein